MSDRVQALVDAFIATIRFTRPCVSDDMLVDDIDIIFAFFGKPRAARADRFLQVTLDILLATFSWPARSSLL